MMQLDHKKSYLTYRILDTNETLRWATISSLIMVIIGFYLMTHWLEFNETRLGYSLYDPILDLVSPKNFTYEIFFSTYAAIFLGLGFSLRTPWMMVRTNMSILALLGLRMVSMYLVPLEPPANIIPLEDSFLMSTVYSNKILMKDLFFSGHTASIALLIFLVEKKWVSLVLLLCGVTVGTLLIMQHVHYSIDILGGFFFAWLAAKFGKSMAEQFLLFLRTTVISPPR